MQHVGTAENGTVPRLFGIALFTVLPNVTRKYMQTLLFSSETARLYRAM
jgi:hypothetical protein